MAFWTRCCKVVLCFADVAESYGIAIGNFVVADTDGAFFTLRDMATCVADEAVGVSFFVDDDCDVSSFGDVFLESFFC